MDVERTGRMRNGIIAIVFLASTGWLLAQKGTSLDELVARLHGAFGASNVDAVYTHWGSAFKAAAHELGLPVGNYDRSRPPQPPLPDLQKAAIRAAYTAIGLIP